MKTQFCVIMVAISNISMLGLLKVSQFSALLESKRELQTKINPRCEILFFASMLLLLGLGFLIIPYLCVISSCLIDPFLPLCVWPCMGCCVLVIK